MAICLEDYVGIEDVGSKRKLVHEICKIISYLKQDYTVSGKGKLTETPDELYARYNIIVAGFPGNNSIWSITLCSSYFSALTNILKDKIEDGTYIMPSLNNM